MVDVQVTCEKLRDRGERILVETLGVERAEASRLLDDSHGHVKSALVMGRNGVSLEEARRLLREADGRVALVVGDPV